MLPQPFYLLLNSYLENRCFEIRFQVSLSKLKPIGASVPQGSILGPLLYVLYTADLPTHPKVTIDTFVDDTALISIDSDHNIASRNLQENLDEVEKWLSKWRIKVNKTKSVHVTFTLRKKTCLQIYINQTAIPQAEEAKVPRYAFRQKAKLEETHMD